MIECIVGVLNNHMADMNVVVAVLSALYSLCVFHGLRKEIDETGVENVISDLKSRYNQDTLVYSRAALTEAELKSDENCFGFIGKLVHCLLLCRTLLVLLYISLGSGDNEDNPHYPQSPQKTVS